MPLCAMAHGQAGRRPFFFAAGHRLLDPRLDPLARVIRVVVVEICFDVLRMIDVAVVTLAVVLPHELPIRRHVVVDDLRHLGPVESLRPDERLDRSRRRAEIRRIIAQRNVR